MYAYMYMLLTLLCTDVGHHCNKIHSFCSKIFIMKIFKCYVYGDKKEKIIWCCYKQEWRFCKDFCSVFCSVKFEVCSPCSYVYVSILILLSLPLKSEKTLSSSRLLFSFCCFWPTVDPLKMIFLDFFNMRFSPPLGIVVLNVQVHAYSHICTPTHSISRKLEHCQLICCIGPLETRN